MPEQGPSGKPKNRIEPLPADSSYVFMIKDTMNRENLTLEEALKKWIDAAFEETTAATDQIQEINKAADKIREQLKSKQP